MTYPKVTLLAGELHEFLIATRKAWRSSSTADDIALVVECGADTDNMAPSDKFVMLFCSNNFIHLASTVTKVSVETDKIYLNWARWKPKIISCFSRRSMETVNFSRCKHDRHVQIEQIDPNGGVAVSIDGGASYNMPSGYEQDFDDEPIRNGLEAQEALSRLNMAYNNIYGELSFRTSATLPGLGMVFTFKPDSKRGAAHRWPYSSYPISSHIDGQIHFTDRAATIFPGRAIEVRRIDWIGGGGAENYMAITTDRLPQHMFWA